MWETAALLLEADRLLLSMAGMAVCGRNLASQHMAAVLVMPSGCLDCPSQATGAAVQAFRRRLLAPLLHSPVLLVCPHVRTTSLVS